MDKRPLRFLGVGLMRVFIAGVMQGSFEGSGIASQDYRERIAELVRKYVPGVDILDPYQLHPAGVLYGPEKARRVFVELAELAASADRLIAYVPVASMGTAVEMWQAYRAGVPVYTVSPLRENWVVLALSSRVFPDMETFERFVSDGGLTEE